MGPGRQCSLISLSVISGVKKTRDWLVAMKANAPVSYPKNSPQVAAANEGTIAIGWVNHYYLHRLDSEGRRARNYSFTEAGDPGNVLMVSGVGVRKGSSKTEAAEAFIEGSWPEQTYFAQEGFSTRRALALRRILT